MPWKYLLSGSRVEAVYDRNRYMDSVLPSATPQNYDKLLINMIMTSNMLCKVRVKVGL